MFGFFRKKEKVPFVRYKILPYQESGFIVERYENGVSPKLYGNMIRFSPLKIEVVKNIEGFFFESECKQKIFQTKEEARQLIDQIIADENQKKAAFNDKIRREEEHAKNNPPEWYPG